MNLFLTRGCNERCSFCYADTWFDTTSAAGPIEPLLAHLRTYARLVAEAPPLPAYNAPTDELSRTFFASRCVNLLGGEPTLHPHFERIVDELHGLGLGVILFTNASRPEKVKAVEAKLWTVTVNGHFARRAPAMGLPMNRVFANLPIAPGDDPIALLEGVAEAGIKGIFLAFVAPVGGRPEAAFRPTDLAEMQRIHGLALDFCERHGIYMGYDCSFPLCVDARVGQTRCSSVPVMDAQGSISICGGEYFYEAGRRPLESFQSLDALHRYTFGLQEALRALPSQFEVCNACPHFNVECHGMCLSYRVKD